MPGFLTYLRIGTESGLQIASYLPHIDIIEPAACLVSGDAQVVRTSWDEDEA